MLAVLPAMSLPEAATTALIFGLPIAIGLLLWPVLGSTGAVRQPSGSTKPGTPVMIMSGPLGLTGQWSVHARSVDAMTARRIAAIDLHRTAARQLGALDYEVCQLWREIRALGRVDA